MLASLADARYEEPSPIQAGVIPVALEGNDILGQARTGTGKTAAFGIPIIETMPSGKGPHALVLVPTRELAVQVRDEIAKLSKGFPYRCVALYGGKPIRGQTEKLKSNPHIIVGTPGRVIDHISRRSLILDQLSIVVLDEADRMLDIGFRPDIEKILRRCPDERQTMLLSATVPAPIERLANRYMHEPVKIDFSPTNVSAETIEQHYFTVDATKKLELLIRLLRREQPTKCIVFCRTKRGTEKLFQRLYKMTKMVRCIHGDMQQGARTRTITDFKANKYRILIATDVVGRGIDISDVSTIVNFDVPEYSDDYVHRVGRTGRMGKEGIAFTFVTPEEGNQLTRIEMRIDKLLIRDEIDGFDPYVKTVVETSPKHAREIESEKSNSDSNNDTAEDADKEKKSKSKTSRKRYRRAL